MNRRSIIASGLILILLGIFFLVKEIFPQFFGFFEWPFSIIGLGVIFILAAILSVRGGLAVPGSILTGIGGILYAQNNFIGYSSWSYMWALIPGFVGIGILISGLIDGNIRHALGGGFSMILISLVMFFVFGGSFGLDPEFVKYWPIILLAFGAIIIINNLAKIKRKSS